MNKIVLKVSVLGILLFSFIEGKTPLHQYVSEISSKDITMEYCQNFINKLEEHKDALLVKDEEGRTPFGLFLQMYAHFIGRSGVDYKEPVRFQRALEQRAIWKKYLYAFFDRGARLTEFHGFDPIDGINMPFVKSLYRQWESDQPS